MRTKAVAVGNGDLDALKAACARTKLTDGKSRTPSDLVALAAQLEAVGPAARTHETRQLVAQAVGMGRTNLGYARKIVERADDGDPVACEARKQMDETGKVQPAYEQMIGHRVSHTERGAKA